MKHDIVTDIHTSLSKSHAGTEQLVYPIKTYHAMGKFCRCQTDDIFLILLENRSWLFMQIISLGDNVHEVSNPTF